MLCDNANFVGLGDLSIVGLSIDSPEWNDLSLEDIRLRIKAGRFGIKYNDPTWQDSLEQIESKIRETRLAKGQKKKSGKKW